MVQLLYLRFNHQVINTAINTISDGSPKHLMDKISRLVTLLTGKQVVNAGKSVSVSTNDPSAMVSLSY